MEPTVIQTAISALSDTILGGIADATPAAFTIFGSLTVVGIVFAIVRKGKRA